MKLKKKKNLLDITPKQTSKPGTTNWIETNAESSITYNTNNPKHRHSSHK